MAPYENSLGRLTEFRDLSNSALDRNVQLADIFTHFDRIFKVMII